MLGIHLTYIIYCRSTDRFFIEHTFKYPKSDICILSDIYVENADGKRDFSRWPSKENIVSRGFWGLLYEVIDKIGPIGAGPQVACFRLSIGLIDAGHGHRLFTKSGDSVEGMLRIPNWFLHRLFFTFFRHHTRRCSPRTLL